MLSIRSPKLLAIALLLTSACASAPPAPKAKDAPGQARIGFLDEREALAVIDELLLEARLEPVAGFEVDLPERRDFKVDVRLGKAAVGIEWISEQDRARYGRLLPAPDPGGQLRVLSGGDKNGQPALILLLDHESYAFPRAPKGDASAERDAERKLRRDLRDFIEYAKTQRPF